MTQDVDLPQSIDYQRRKHERKEMKSIMLKRANGWKAFGSKGKASFQKLEIFAQVLGTILQRPAPSVLEVEEVAIIRRPWSQCGISEIAQVIPKANAIEVDIPK